MIAIAGTQIDENRGNATMSTTLYRPDESIVRRPGRAEASFLETIVGRRGGLRSILTEVEAVAPTNATVLITGETGTGKEVIARAIHELSPRRSRNLVKVNCAALPAGLLEKEFHEATGWLGIREVLTAPQSPWQNPYVERLIGTIRRECLDHVIVLHEPGLRRVLKLYFEYYERTRTHLSLDKDAPIPRRVQPPELGKVVELPQVGGLHHRYERRAA